MQHLTQTQTLHIRQIREWGEILTGWETRNRYEIQDDQGRLLYLAGEVSGSWLSRSFLGSLRPFTLEIRSPDGRLVLRAERVFRWYFHEITVSDGHGRRLGSVRRVFAWLRRRYRVHDVYDREIGLLRGPFLHPWTFDLWEAGRRTGRIRKRWSGVAKEGFTDADNFSVEFPPDWEQDRRALLLGAVFLIDFVHFERSGKN